MFQRLLVSLDGSERAEQALPVAARIARATGGSVFLVQVVNPLIDYSGGLAPVPLLTDQAIETEMAQAADYLKKVASSQVVAGIETTTEAGSIRWVSTGRGRFTTRHLSHHRLGSSRTRKITFDPGREAFLPIR